MTRKEKLSERALKLYEKKKEEDKEYKRKESEEFAKKAKQRFIECFGHTVGFDYTEDEINVIPDWSDYALIVVDDVTFVAKNEHDACGIRFYVLVKCAKCGKEFVPDNIWPVSNLEDVGKVLSGQYVCKDCKSHEEQKQKTNENKSVAEMVAEHVAEIFELIFDEHRE